MSQALQRRAKAFLSRPVPKGIRYARGSAAERILVSYAEQGHLAADAELTELLDLCVMETAAAVEGHQGEASAYFRESAAILEGIRAELG